MLAASNNPHRVSTPIHPSSNLIYLNIHRAGLPGRIRLPGPDQVGGAPVDGLEVRARRADVAGRTKRDAADGRPSEIGEHVAEEVLGDDHVEVARFEHERLRRRVDVAALGLDLWVLRRDLEEDLAEE